ncbi:hypothetical protein [Aneurinibacillus sp. UBA3580]|jgi:hypothetical protein|uniref:hypothetical protein n=1 Tax=Aneurinibacillus sp. UBA3580 TaxID=1946041 RepID=UPI00257CCB1B|nr:hypothetical protein [Aneurinibacillus sp. UBA3580]
MSFANWDEIINTCITYSAKNLHSFTSPSPIVKCTPSRIAKAVKRTKNIGFKRLDGPDLQDPWTNEPYDEMLAREYVYTTSKT